MGHSVQSDRVVFRVISGDAGAVKGSLEEKGIIYAEEKEGEISFSVLPEWMGGFLRHAKKAAQNNPNL